MPTDALFHWVVLNQDIPHSVIKVGDRALIVDRLRATAKQPEPGYLLEVFEQGETLDVIAVPISWVTLLPEVWGQADGVAIEAS